jgi:hypothetical protein
VSAYDGSLIPVRAGEEGDDCAHRSDPPQYRDRVGPIPRLVSPARNLPTHQGIVHWAGGVGEAEHQSIGGVFSGGPSPKLDQQGADAVAVVGGEGQSAAVGGDPALSPGARTEDRDHR